MTTNGKYSLRVGFERCRKKCFNHHNNALENLGDVMAESTMAVVSDKTDLNFTPGNRRVAIAALLAVTLVWGATFIWMKQALDSLDDEKAEIGTNGVVAVLVFARFAIAAIMMLVFFKKARTSLSNVQIWKDGVV